MIYDFEGHTPKTDPNSRAAPNAVLIGKVELKNFECLFNATLRGDIEPIVMYSTNIQDGSVLHTDQLSYCNWKKCDSWSFSNVTWVCN